MKTNQSGFTLIELMITVAIVAILAAVALPGYQSHVRSSRRAEAQAFLMAVSVREQQFLVDTQSYTSSLTDIGVPIPTNVQLGYNLSLATPTPTTFTVTASPKTLQSGERCGTLSIDQAGTKMPSTTGCW